MNWLLALALMLPLTAHARWFERLCSMLVVEGPVYAETPTDDLLTLYGITHSEEAFKELDFRAHAYMMTREELELFSVFIQAAAAKAQRESE